MINVQQIKPEMPVRGLMAMGLGLALVDPIVERRGGIVGLISGRRPNVRPRLVVRVTAVVLVAHLGPLSDYESAAALEKACGLNLKIKSSGNYDGRVAITKRGSSVVRRYLYLAALRLIRDDVRIAAWFRSRAGYLGGRKLIAVVAVMRKLIRALWHVARGAVFDSSKLVDERALPALNPDAALAPFTNFARPVVSARDERRALIASLRTLVRARCSRGSRLSCFPCRFRSSRSPSPTPKSSPVGPDGQPRRPRAACCGHST